MRSEITAQGDTIFLCEFYGASLWRHVSVTAMAGFNFASMIFRRSVLQISQIWLCAEILEKPRDLNLIFCRKQRVKIPTSGFYPSIPFSTRRWLQHFVVVRNSFQTKPVTQSLLMNINHPGTRVYNMKKTNNVQYSIEVYVNGPGGISVINFKFVVQNE